MKCLEIVVGNRKKTKVRENCPPGNAATCRNCRRCRDSVANAAATGDEAPVIRLRTLDDGSRPTNQRRSTAPAASQWRRGADRRG